MKVEVTIERLKVAKKSAPARWVVVGKRTFDGMDREAQGWAKGLGMPEDMEQAQGWAIRMAVLA